MDKGGADKAAAFRAWLGASLKQQRSPELAPFTAALDQIDLTAPRRSLKPRLSHAAMGNLDQATAKISVAAPLDAIVDLDWSQVFTGGGIDPILADGMIAAQLAGSYGRIPSDQIACGLFLLSPGVRYPLHTHASEEIYLWHAAAAKWVTSMIFSSSSLAISSRDTLAFDAGCSAAIRRFLGACCRSYRIF